MHFQRKPPLASVHSNLPHFFLTPWLFQNSPKPTKRPSIAPFTFSQTKQPISYKYGLQHQQQTQETIFFLFQIQFMYHTFLHPSLHNSCSFFPLHPNLLFLINLHHHCFLCQALVWQSSSCPIRLESPFFQ